MERFEKVVKGLECCIATNGSYCPDKCPYKNICFARKGMQDIYVHLFEDALVLIRQQQERIKELEAERQWHSCGNCDIPAALLTKVMTLEEVKDNEVVYLEDFTEPDDGVEPIIRPAINIEAKNGGIVMLDSATWDDGFLFVVDSEYGKTWRCWTQRPTDEQRKAVRWE